jgi:hypothetical protein
MPENAAVGLVVSPRKYGHLFQETGIPASVYHAILLSRYGTKIYAWEPESINMEIEADFGVNPSGEVRDKIHGIIAAMTCDRVFKDPLIFGNICHALNDTDPSFEWLAPVEPEEAAWASYEILLNTHETPTAFSDEVKAYVRVILSESGFFKCPKEFGWCDLPSHIDMSKFTITEPAKKIQQVKLDRITEYVNLRKKRMLAELRDLFPGVSLSPSLPQESRASSRKVRPTS